MFLILLQTGVNRLVSGAVSMVASVGVPHLREAWKRRWLYNLLVVPKNHSISTDGPKKSPAFLEHTLFGVRSKRSSMRRATLQPTYSSHSPLSTSTVS